MKFSIAIRVRNMIDISSKYLIVFIIPCLLIQISCKDNPIVSDLKSNSVVVDSTFKIKFSNIYPIISKNNYSNEDDLYLAGSFTQLDSTDDPYNLLIFKKGMASLNRVKIASYVGKYFSTPTNSVTQNGDFLIITSYLSGIKFISDSETHSRWMNLFGGIQVSSTSYGNGILIGTSNGNLVYADKLHETLIKKLGNIEIKSIATTSDRINILVNISNSQSFISIDKNNLEIAFKCDLENSFDRVWSTDNENVYITGFSAIKKFNKFTGLSDFKGLGSFDFINIKSDTDIIYFDYFNIYHFNGESSKLIYSLDAADNFPIYTAYLKNYYLIITLGIHNQIFSIHCLKIKESPNV